MTKRENIERLRTLAADLKSKKPKNTAPKVEAKVEAEVEEKPKTKPKTKKKVTKKED